MILQKLASAIRRQDWFQVLVEVLIVIVGIFLGLQVQAWYEQEQAMAEEERIIEYLIADLESNVRYLDARIDFYELRIDQGYQALNILERGTINPDETVVFEEAITRIGTVGSINAYLNAFNERNLSLIQNNELRREIEAYLGTVNLVKDIFINQLSPKVTNHTDLIGTRGTVLKQPGRGDILLYDFEALSDDNEFKAAYASLVRYIITAHQQSRSIWFNSRNLLEMLKNYQVTGIVEQVDYAGPAAAPVSGNQGETP